MNKKDELNIKDENVIDLIYIFFMIFFELTWRLLKNIFNLFEKLFNWILKKFTDKKTINKVNKEKLKKGFN